MIITKKRHRLAAKWDPTERDISADLGPRMNSADVYYLLSKVVTKEVCLELERRGFDLKTLRFQIDRTPASAEKWDGIYPPT